MSFWEYEDRRTRRQRSSRTFRTGAVQSSFRELAGQELRQRGIDPAPLRSLRAPTPEQIAAHTGRAFPDPFLKGSPTGDKQVQYLRNIQRFIREGTDPEEAVGRAEAIYREGEESGGFLGKLARGAASGLEAAQKFATKYPIIGGPFAEAEGPGTSALGRFFARTDPIAAAGLQVIGQTGPLGGPAIGPTRVVAPEVSEQFRRPELSREGLINPVVAQFRESEREKAQRVLEEAGLFASMAARLLLDPSLLFPGVGLTHFKDLATLTRAASRLTGTPRTAIVAAIRGNRAFRAAAEAGEVGGGRLRAVEPTAAELLGEQAHLGTKVSDGVATAAERARYAEVKARLGRMKFKEPLGETVQAPARRAAGPFVEGLEAPARSPEELARRTAEAAGVERTVPIRAPEVFQPSPKSEHLRAQVAAEGGEPPKLPPVGGDKGPGGGDIPSLIPDGQGPSLSLWRTIENAVTFGDDPRALVETLNKIPALRPFTRVLTSPSALARIDPATRASVVYRRLQSIQVNELTYRMADLERRFKGLFQEAGAPGTVRLASGNDVPFGDLATDVLADGNKFPISSSQRSWVLDSKRLIDDAAAQYEAVTGDVIRLEGADYWPRFVTDEDGRVYVKGRVGAKQSPTKERLYAEQETGIAAGVSYAGPLDSLRLYGESLQKMVRDDLLKKVFREDKIGRSVAKAHSDAIVSVRATLKRMTDEGIELQDLGEFQRLNKKLERLVTARDKIRTVRPHKGEVTGQALGPAFQQTVFKRKMLKTIQDIIGPGLTGKPGGALRVATYVAAVPRFLVTGLLDVGHFAIQLMTLLVSDQKSWARAVGESVQSMIMPQHFRRFLSEAPAARRAIRYGVDVGGTEWTEVTRRSHVLRRIPGAKQAATVLGAFPRGFETAIAAGKIFNFDGMAEGMIKAGVPESELYRLAGYVNTKLGTTNLLGLGLSTTQRQVESAFALYSPRYTRSLFGTIGWMFSKGVPAADARKTVAGMLLGGAAAYYGFARAVGLSHEEATGRLNPQAGARFLAIPYGGMEFGIGTGFRATLVFLGSMLSEDSWDFDSWNDALTDNPIVRYLRARTSPTTATLMDFIDGEDFVGREVSPDMFFDDPSRLLAYSEGKFLPLNIEAIMEARGPTWQKLLAGGVETVGGRAFPQSAFRLFQEAQEREFERLKSLGEAPYTKYDSYAQLREADSPAAEAIDDSAAVVEAVDRMEKEGRYRKQTPEKAGFERLKETRAAQAAEQTKDDERLLAGAMPPDAWQTELRFRQREYFARREQIIEDFGLTFKDKEPPPHSVNAAIEDYFAVDVDKYTDPMTAQVNWSGFFKAREDALRQLSPDNRNRVTAYVRKYDTPLVKAFKSAQDKLRPYYDVADEAWERFRGSPDLAPYATYDDWLSAQVEGLTKMGVPAEDLQSYLTNDPVTSRLSKAVGELRARYRVQHPDVDALLVKWYGLVPIRLQRDGGGSRRTRRTR